MYVKRTLGSVKAFSSLLQETITASLQLALLNISSLVRQDLHDSKQDYNVHKLSFTAMATCKMQNFLLYYSYYRSSYSANLVKAVFLFIYIKISMIVSIKTAATFYKCMS